VLASQHGYDVARRIDQRRVVLRETSVSAREGQPKKAQTPTSSKASTPTAGNDSKRSPLRGMTFDQGAAALAPHTAAGEKPASGSSRTSAGGDTWESARFDVSAQIGEKGWRTRADLEGVEDREAFIASLEAQWPTTTPLHELPYAMELAIINWGHFHAGLGDDPEVRHVFTEKTPTGQFVVADAIEQMDLDTYKRSPATIADLRR